MQKIIVRNLVKSFGERELFKIESLEINENEVVGIVGNNGSGKTTFLNILAGQIGYDSGIVDIKGKVTYIKQFEGALTGQIWDNLSVNNANEFYHIG